MPNIWKEGLKGDFIQINEWKHTQEWILVWGAQVQSLGMTIKQLIGLRHIIPQEARDRIWYTWPVDMTMGNYKK